MRSVYHEFNRELDKMEAARNANGFYAVKKKYDKVAVWSEDGTSYDINCSGLIEAGVVNLDGLVKVNGELLHFSKDAITASASDIKNTGSNSKTISNRRVIWSRTSGGVGTFGQTDYEAWGTPPASNSFTVGAGKTKQAPPITNTGHEAWGYAQARVFNFISDIYNRGFCTIRFYADHKNWLGVWRRVRSFGGRISGHMTLTIRDHDLFPLYFGTGDWNNPGQTIPEGGPNWDAAEGEENEVVIVVSTYLKQNPATYSFLPSYLNNQFVHSTRWITENGIATEWQVFRPFGTLGHPLTIHFASIGEGPAPVDHAFQVSFRD